MRTTAYHGTDEKAKESIQENGFRCSEDDLPKIGRCGSGAYFWKYIPDHEDVCEKLAFGFVHRNSESKNCVAWCIKVEINVEDDKFLDFNDDFLKGRLLSVCARFDKNDRVFTGKVYNLVREELEQELGFKILAYEVPVKPPKSCDFPIDLIGMPNCIVVREKSVIKIIECKSEV